jgi:hypothetical protein
MIAKGQIVDDSSNKDKNGRDRRGNNNNNKRGQGKDATAGDHRGKRPKVEIAEAAANAPGSTEPSEEDDEDDIMDPVKDAVTSKDPRAGSRNNRSHDENVAQTVRAKTVCRYFTRGTCNRGDKCPYIHDTAQAVSRQLLLRWLVK